MAQINKPTDYFNTVLYTGNGTTNTGITGVGFQPDLNWIKKRSFAGNNFLTDAVRGVGRHLNSENTNAENVYSEGIKSFDSDGFTLGSGSDINDSSETYVAWNWLASNTTASNTDGSITSTVSANTTSGFSVVSWTGDGTSTATIGHSLGVVPSMIILKNRTDVTNWVLKHKSLSSGYNLFLNDSSAVYNTTGQGHLADLSSSSTFGFVAGSSGNNQSNGSGDSMIAYCFAEKKGFSKFGSYTGNGSTTDGTFVYTGFKPAWIMVKRTDGADHWTLWDNKRESNPNNNVLYPSTNGAESTSDSSYLADLVSNGIKWRGNSTGMNTSGANYIYMAFAENPLVGTNNIPATAR